ncbi:MAG: hypothetical protein U5Q44_11785 [Dehalococcoidia bacterium]|nr:hypothetical protein [Dehalococcoidia bacterium]
MDGAVRPFPGSIRYLYYATRFTGQAAQNILLAGIFLAAGTSGSAAIDLSSVFVAILVPAVLLGPLGGALADRLGPARAYPLGAFLRFLVAGFALYALTGVGWVWAVAFLYSAASQLFTPAEMALVNSLRRGGSGGIHSSLQAQQYVAQGMGMVALAPALYFLGGLPAILLGAIAGKALLVVLALGLARAMRGSTAIHGQRSREAFGFRPVARFFLAEHAATYAVALQAFKTIVSRAVFVALPCLPGARHGRGAEHARIPAGAGRARHRRRPALVAHLQRCDRPRRDASVHARACRVGVRAGRARLRPLGVRAL